MDGQRGERVAPGEPPQVCRFGAHFAGQRSTVAPMPLVAEEPVLSNPWQYTAFRNLPVGQATSSLGKSFSPVALAFAVLHLGGSATDLGIVLAAYALAQVVTTLVGGVLGDRLPRSLMMQGSSAVLAVIQAIVAASLSGVSVCARSSSK